MRKDEGGRMKAEGVTHFRPYPAYKDSGVEWLGEVPAHWEVKRLKRAFRVINGSTPETGTPQYWDGDLAWVTPEDLGDLDTPEISRTRRLITAEGYRSCGTSVVPPGSLVLSTRAPIGHLAIAGVELCTNQGCRSLVFRRPSVVRYFYHELAAARPELESLGQGSTFRELAKGKLDEVIVTEPPALEQRAIAAFLDRETARIDALVVKKERLIELLQEKRTALIEAAVGGERGSRETRLGYYVDLLPGYAFPSEEFSHDPDDVRLLRGVNVSPECIRWDDTVLWPASKSTRFTDYHLKEGDLVFGMDRPWISAGIRVAEVTGADVPSLLLQRVARLRARSGLSQKYLKLVLSSPQFRAYFEPILTGISVPHVSPEQILSFRFRPTALDVQELTCRQLGTHLMEIKSMRDVLERSIDRLKELRTALISAAVTGKIDVRTEAA